MECKIKSVEKSKDQLAAESSDDSLNLEIFNEDFIKNFKINLSSSDCSTGDNGMVLESAF